MLNKTPISSSKATYTYTIPAEAFTSAGTYVVSVYAFAKGYTQSVPSIIHVVVQGDVQGEGTSPAVTSIETDKSEVAVGNSVQFTVQTNTSASGVQLYIHENGNTYNLGCSQTATASSSTTKTFEITYIFNSTGYYKDGKYKENIRTIYAYPIDSENNVVDTTESKKSTEITVKPSQYSFEKFSVNNISITYGDSAEIRWSAAQPESRVTVYYNVFINNISVISQKTSDTKVVINANTLQELGLGVGTYPITVIATASNHQQREAVGNLTINHSMISSDKEKPVINPISSSVSPITFGSPVTFSTTAADKVKLAQVIMYIDNKKVKTVISTGTVSHISYTTDSLEKGTHVVRVEAYDAAGNKNSHSQNFDVVQPTGGSIYSVKLSPNHITAGEYITFTVKTSTDTTKIRLLDRSFAFGERSTGYKDSGKERIWVFDQYVNTSGSNRTLKVETYSGGWTGNYATTERFTVEESTNDLGDFAILTPQANSKHQMGSVLTVQWSSPSIEPDRYVVNVTGSSPIEVDGNSNTAVINGSVFGKPDTYVVSVTAQKAKYNQSTTYVNVTVDCNHVDKQQTGKTYDAEVYVNENCHRVFAIPSYMCNTCGATFTNHGEGNYELAAHTHDTVLENNGWYCNCGYVNSGSYTPWNGYLQSTSNQSVYSKIDSAGNLSQKIGTVYTTDVILVCGEKDGAYFIRYPVSN